MSNSNNGLPPELTGASPQVHDCLAQLHQAATDGRGALIVAERGLDPEAVGRTLHLRSGRHEGPFVVLPCAGSPQDVERALFGAPRRRGDELEALSTASALARAHMGVLFLDEVTELSTGAQRRLARVLRDGEVLRQGSSYAPRGAGPSRGPGRLPLEVRLVAATSHGLAGAVDDGRLVDELARRLPLVIDVPALRQRREDINEIAARLLAERAPGRQFTPAALTVLAALPWRRNIAELRALIDRLATAGSGPTILQEEVLAEVQLDRPPLRPASNLREARRQFERDHIAAVLRDYGWHMREAARALGIERANLYRKARQLGIPLRRGTSVPARMTR